MPSIVGSVERHNNAPLPSTSLRLCSAVRIQLFTVFYAPPWAIWLGESSGIVDAWLAGATVLDPTCGRGDLLLGLIATAMRRGWPAHELPVWRLFGVEREAPFLRALVDNCRREFGLEFPQENLRNVDILTGSLHLRVHALLGNPPWANFATLPAAEKAALKPLFVRYGLAPDRRRLLLGGSRVDVAALIVAKTMANHLEFGGKAAFFLPLSLLSGDTAHAGFRRYRVDGVPFRRHGRIGFDWHSVFPGVATRYGAVRFLRDVRPKLAGPVAAWDDRRFPLGEPH